MLTRRLSLSMLAVLLVAAAAFAISIPKAARACAQGTGRIAYVVQDGCTMSIWTMGEDGTDPTKVSGDYGEVIRPMWSHDHTMLIFAAESGAGRDVMILRADGSTTVFENPADDGWPSFTPDDTRIVFASDRSGSREIWIMNSDGSDPGQLTSLGGNSYSPSVSPDGSRIVFVSSGGGNEDIYAMSIDGSDLQQLTSSAHPDIDPAWSPDGTRIVWSAGRPGGLSNIWSMNPDGSDARQIETSFCVIDRSPSWSPDGSRVLFARQSGATVELFSVSTTDPTDVVQLTFGSVAGIADPVWGAAPTPTTTPTTTPSTTVDPPLGPAYTC